VEVVVIDFAVSFLDPSGADEVRMNTGRRGAQGWRGRPFAAVGEDDVFQVIMAEGFVGKRLFDGGFHFGRAEEFGEAGDFF